MLDPPTPISAAALASGKPGVAVVMPVLNGADHIALTLEAVMRQTHPPAEVVVVDDGCTDESPAIAAGFPGVRVVRNTGQGLDPARAFGLAQVTSPLVALLDHDDPWHPEHLRLMVAALEAFPEASAAVCHARPFVDGTDPEFDSPELDVETANPWDLFPGCFTRTPSSVVMRRAALDSIDGWSTAFWPTSELYMWLRLFEWGPLVVSRRTTVGYRLRSNSRSAEHRRDYAVQSVEQVAAAAEEAVRERAARFPMERDVLARRDAIARAVRHLGAGILGNDLQEIARGAAYLEEGTINEPPERIRAAFDPLFWVVQGYASSPGTDSEVWRALIAGWPRTASRTAPHRLPFHSLSHLLRSALNDPAAPWRWRWLMEVARYRLAGRLPG